MPNIWSCAPGWFEKMKAEQPKVVVATWAEAESDSINEWLEKLQALEDEGIPVFVVDADSCPTLAEKLGKGEAIVFEHGVEKGRLAPGEGLEKVRELYHE